MTPKPPKGIQSRLFTVRELRAAERRALPRWERCIYDCDCTACAFKDEIERLKTERDSYREQVKSLLAKLGAQARCPCSGGET